MLDPDPEQDGTDSADANANAAAAEEKASEPKPASSSARFLANIKDTLVEEIEKYGQPLCYKNGDFFIRAPHPCFVLRRAQAMGFSPEKLYHRDVFVWLPDLLVPQMRFYCKCGMILSKNGTSHLTFPNFLLINILGYNDNPIARRIRHVPSDYFLLTNRYLCNKRRAVDPGCNASYQGTDSHIISQLPRYLQCAFPGLLIIHFRIEHY